MADFLVSFPGLGIHNLPINRVIFELNLFGRTLSIYWYGLLIATAFLLAMLLAMKQADKFGLNADAISEMFLWIIPLGLVGARLYYVVFAWDEFAGNLAKIFDTRTGGLAFYGGVIGGVLGVVIWSAIRKQPFYKVADFLIVYLPLGQAIGRWGNFVNQEAFGTNTTLPWGMISNGTTRYLQSLNLPGVSPNLPVHPTFFYEFVANMVIFVILLRVRKYATTRYSVLSLYLILYGVVRFFVEGIRTDALYVGGGGIRVSQWLSAAMVLAGIVLLVAMHVKQRKTLISTLQETTDDLDVID